MIYVFEGPRNSGKTFLSKHISKRFEIKRFQFLFPDYFSRLKMTSKNSKEAHAFSMGKELMIMQLFRDIDFGNSEVIHDRGILTVLAWGLMENRITEEEMIDQVKLIRDFDLMNEVRIVFVTGNNPDKGDRNKDEWDRIDGDPRELESYQKVISAFESYGIARIRRFENNFDSESLTNLDLLFEEFLLN